MRFWNAEIGTWLLTTEKNSEKTGDQIPAKNIKNLHTIWWRICLLFICKLASTFGFLKDVGPKNWKTRPIRIMKMWNSCHFSRPQASSRATLGVICNGGQSGPAILLFFDWLQKNGIWMVIAIGFAMVFDMVFMVPRLQLRKVLMKLTAAEEECADEATSEASSVEYLPTTPPEADVQKT